MIWYWHPSAHMEGVAQASHWTHEHPIQWDPVEGYNIRHRVGPLLAPRSALQNPVSWWTPGSIAAASGGPSLCLGQASANTQWP